jgi:hypothetical protein
MGVVVSRAVADLLDLAAAGPVSLVIEGEAGIGKTTAWLAGVEQARERGFLVLSAQPAEAESVQAYASLADLLDEVAAAIWADLPGPHPLPRRTRPTHQSTPRERDIGKHPINRS